MYTTIYFPGIFLKNGKSKKIKSQKNKNIHAIPVFWQKSTIFSYYAAI